MPLSRMIHTKGCGFQGDQRCSRITGGVYSLLVATLLIIDRLTGRCHETKTITAQTPISLDPERFLEANRRDPARFGFGFRQRLESHFFSSYFLVTKMQQNLPGRYVAMNSLFILVSCILQMFNISRE